jgi:hypothetical protein
MAVPVAVVWRIRHNLTAQRVRVSKWWPAGFGPDEITEGSDYQALQPTES